MLFAVQRSTIKSSVCGCLRFCIIMRSVFSLVQLVGPVLSYSISRKSGIIREFFYAIHPKKKAVFCG